MIAGVACTQFVLNDLASAAELLTHRFETRRFVLQSYTRWLAAHNALALIFNDLRMLFGRQMALNGAQLQCIAVAPRDDGFERILLIRPIIAARPVVAVSAMCNETWRRAYSAPVSSPLIHGPPGGQVWFAGIIPLGALSIGIRKTAICSPTNGSG